MFLIKNSKRGNLLNPPMAMKKVLDRTYRLGPKIREREGAGGGSHPPSPIEQKLTYFSNHENDIQS